MQEPIHTPELFMQASTMFFKGASRWSLGLMCKVGATTERNADIRLEDAVECRVCVIGNR